MFKERDQLIQDSVFKSMFRLGLPAVSASMFIVVFELVDMFWVGRLGAESIAALGAASFIVWLLRALAQTIGTGALSLVSRRAGERDEAQVLRLSADAITAGVVFTVMMFVITLPVLPFIYGWLGLKASVASLAQEYNLIFMVGLVFITLMVVAEHVLRGVGNAKTPMIIMGITLFLNAVLDPVFIFHFDMGLAGAAYATLLAHIVGCIAMLMAMQHTVPSVQKQRLRLGRMFYNQSMWPMFRIGVPISIQGVGFALIYILLAGIIAHFGTEALAAVSICHRIEGFPFFVAFGFSMAVATLVGQNLGAGQIDKAQASVILALKITCSVLLATSLAFFLIPEWIMTLFTHDALVVQHGVTYLKIIAIFEVFLALEVVLEGAFVGAGQTLPPLIVGLPFTFIRLPLAWLFGIKMQMGINAVWFVIGSTTLLKGSIILGWFLKGSWKHQKL